MKHSIVYSSAGNTKLLADAINNFLGDDKLVYYGKPDKYALDADIIYVGFWTNMGVCDDLTKEFLRKIKNKKIFLFGSAGFNDPEYFKQIIKKTKDFLDESVTVVGTFMCQGKMHSDVKDKYLKIKQNDPNNKRVDMLIDMFDKALQHPNDEDIKNLLDKIK